MTRTIARLATIGAMAAAMAMAQTATPAAPAAGRAQGQKARIQKRMLKALDLTATQKQQAKAIRQATKEQAQPLATQLKTARQTLNAAVQAGDSTRIQQSALDVGNLQGHVLAIRSDGRSKFLAILTPDQKAKAAEFRGKVKQVLGKG